MVPKPLRTPWLCPVTGGFSPTVIFYFFVRLGSSTSTYCVGKGPGHQDANMKIQHLQKGSPELENLMGLGVAQSSAT